MRSTAGAGVDTGDAGGTGVGTGDADGAGGTGTGRRGHKPTWATRARVGAGAIPNDKTYLL